MEQKEQKRSGNELRPGMCMTFPECKTCVDIKHCKVLEKRGEDLKGNH